MIKENLIQYFENSIRGNWDKKALCDYGNGHLTYGETANNIFKIHKLFEDSGIQKGDKITLIGKNSGNWASVYLATISYGAVIVPLLQDFKPTDIYNLVNHSESKLLFGSPLILESVEFKKFETLQCIYNLEDFSLNHDCNGKGVKFPKNHPEVKENDFKFAKIPNDSLAAILYTSGTSGQPKGVMLNHNSIAVNIRYAQANMPLISEDRIVSFLPLAHSYGCAFEFLYPFSLGCTITFLGKLPTPNIVVQAFNEIKPRLILTVPLVIEKIYKNKIKPVLNKPTVKIIAKIPLVNKIIFNKIRKSLEESFGNNFKEVVIGGAKLNREVEVFLKKIRFRFSVGYGMTECGPLIAYDGWKTTKIHSTGKAIDALEFKIDSRDPQNRVGEILIKGENVMLGYYKNPEITAQTIEEDGWMHSGDLGIIDKDGYLFIKGRNKSLILGASGKNIYPEDIESKLNNLPLVSECLVVGRDTKIVAMVYPDHDKRKLFGIKEDEIETAFADYKNEINEDLPAYMNISRIEIREKEFEKTPKKSIKRYLYK
ncbi:MAG: AMP-binding protein [Bacteroidota bacterium]|nr:AMP-binding protein [Bacteroidota bacterium]